MKYSVGGVVFTVVVAIFTSGCFTPTAPSAAHQAHAAQTRGDWAAAVPLWKQAIQEQSTQEHKSIWKEQFAAPPTENAALYYELGRSEGAICQWDAAVQDLDHALAIDDRTRGPVWMDLLELGRLYHAKGDNVQAEMQFDRLFKDMPEDILAKRDPNGLYGLLMEASQTKAGLGKTSESVGLRTRAEKLRAKNPRIAPPADWTPYGLHCQ